MRIFFDSSAFAKKYIMETGSDMVLDYLAQADEVVISVVAIVETLSALNRRKREKAISSQMYRKIKKEISLDLKAASVVEILAEVIAKSTHCLERSPLRSLDAIQVASALVSEPDLFITGDTRQAAAARKAGLAVVSV